MRTRISKFHFAFIGSKDLEEHETLKFLYQYVFNNFVLCIPNNEFLKKANFSSAKVQAQSYSGLYTSNTCVETYGNGGSFPFRKRICGESPRLGVRNALSAAPEMQSDGREEGSSWREWSPGRRPKYSHKKSTYAIGK